MRTFYGWAFERSRPVLLLFSFLWGTQDCSLLSVSGLFFWAHRSRCHFLHLPMALRKTAVFVSRKSGPFAHVAVFQSPNPSAISSHLLVNLLMVQLTLTTILSKAQIDRDLRNVLLFFASSTALTVFQSRCHPLWKRHANAVKVYKISPLSALKSPF